MHKTAKGGVKVCRGSLKSYRGWEKYRRKRLYQFPVPGSPLGQSGKPNLTGRSARPASRREGFKRISNLPNDCSFAIKIVIPVWPRGLGGQGKIAMMSSDILSVASIDRSFLSKELIEL